MTPTATTNSAVPGRAPRPGDAAPRRTPGARRCVQSRVSGDRRNMIRFVVDPTGTVVPDLAEHLPGRGVWLTAERSVIDKALGGQGFARAVRRQVKVPGDLASSLERLLRQRCVEGLGLARRAGELVAGFEQVADWLRNGRAGLVVVAADASAGQRSRLERVASAAEMVSGLGRDELGRSVGRDELTYVAVAPGRLAARLARDLDRLAGVRGLSRLAGPAGPVVEPEAAGTARRQPFDKPASTAPDQASSAATRPLTSEAPAGPATEHRYGDDNAI